MQKYPFEHYSELCRLFDDCDLMFISWHDIDLWHIDDISGCIRDTLGYTRDDFISGALKFNELLSSEARLTFKQELLHAIVEKQDHCQHRPFSIYTPDREEVWLKSTTKILHTSKGDVQGFITYIYDITIQKEYEHKHELHTLIFRNTSEGILITDAQKNIISINPAFQKITRYSDSYILGKNPKIFASGKHDKAFYRDMWETINSRGEWQGKIWNRRFNGELYAAWTCINVIYDKYGNIQHYIAFFSDITESTKAFEKLKYHAHHDRLTALPNRILFQDRVEQAIKDAKRHQTKFALLYLDLDNFKTINDTKGHEIGDLLLQKISTKLLETVREEDTVSRHGGDEFLILIKEMTHIKQVYKIINKLKSSIGEGIIIQNEPIHTSFSIGVSIFSDYTDDFSTLLKHADMAMYQAKKEGKNTYHFYDKAMDIKIKRLHEIQNRLSQALKNRELSVLFQPQYDIHTHKIFGMEALLRWHHPELGMIPPSEFIPIAEECGLINDIGDFVIKQSCQTLKELQEQGQKELMISINISAIQFNHPLFVKRLETIINTYDIDPKYIELEVTESILLQDNTQNSQSIKELKALGFSIAIDDFGTGYASLSYLKRFFATTLKIDYSFISNMLTDKDDIKIIQAVISLGQSFGMNVIAEGIETQAQLNELKKLKCDSGQGFFLSHPLPASKLLKTLKQKSA